MLDSDADRLAMIKGLGGQLVRSPLGEFWAIFDNEYYEAAFNGPPVESSQPGLTARTIDVASLVKDTPLEVTQSDGTVKQYLFKKHEPDGTGMSRVLLKG